MPTELQEALTAANVSALVPKDIDLLLFEAQRRYSPLFASIPSVKWGSNVYNFNTRTSMPTGGAVQDGGARPVSNSNYTQTPYTIRNFQAVGAVTGFSQEVTRAIIGDLLRREMEGATKGLTWSIENDICWGNSASSQVGPYPTFDGLDTQVSQFVGTASNPQNSVDVGATANTVISTGWLDYLIELVETNAAEPIMGTGWMFVLSSAARSAVSQLLMNQQRFTGNGPTAEVAAGITLPTYRDIPMCPTSFLGSRGLTMGTVSLATATTGGVIPLSTTYYYRVAPVFARMGECVASTQQTLATGSGTSTNTITLSFATPTGYQGATPDFYKVFRSSTTNTETLLGYVPGNVGLLSDGVTPVPTTSIIDTGAALVPMNGATGPVTPPVAYFGTNTGHLPRSAGTEDVYLISRNPDNVVRPYVRPIQSVNVATTVLAPDSLPFALVSDSGFAVRAPQFVGRLRNVGVSISTAVVVS